MILVDSNVWIDLIQRDPKWLEWSARQVQSARQAGPLAINAVIYAELVPNYDSSEDMEQFMRLSGAKLMPLSEACAYEAGRAFELYRKRGGAKTGVVADFLIGAQALTEGWTLLTRDAGRYKTYFPKIKLICPE
jgi:predicted nucleic acid-binding protein